MDIFERSKQSLRLNGDINNPTSDLRERIERAIQRQPTRFFDKTTDQDKQNNVLRMEVLIDLDNSHTRAMQYQVDPFGLEIWDNIWIAATEAARAQLKHLSSNGRALVPGDDYNLDSIAQVVNNAIASKIGESVTHGVIDTSDVTENGALRGYGVTVTLDMEGTLYLTPNSELLQLKHLLLTQYLSGANKRDVMNIRDIDTSKIHRVMPWPEDTPAMAIANHIINPYKDPNM